MAVVGYPYSTVWAAALCGSPEIAGQWLKALPTYPTFTEVTSSAIVQIARRAGDRSRDIDDAIREKAISRLVATGMGEEAIELEPYGVGLALDHR